MKQRISAHFPLEIYPRRYIAQGIREHFGSTRENDEETFRIRELSGDGADRLRLF